MIPGTNHAPLDLILGSMRLENSKEFQQESPPPKKLPKENARDQVL